MSRRVGVAPIFTKNLLLTCYRSFVEFVTQNRFSLDFYKWIHNTGHVCEHYLNTLATLSVKQEEDKKNQWRIVQRYDMDIKDQPMDWSNVSIGYKYCLKYIKTSSLYILKVMPHLYILLLCIFILEFLEQRKFKLNTAHFFIPKLEQHPIV